MTLTILTILLKTNSKLANLHSENRKINKRPFQIQPIDITTIDRKVKAMIVSSSLHLISVQTGGPSGLTSMEHCLALVSW